MRIDIKKYIFLAGIISWMLFSLLACGYTKSSKDSKSEIIEVYSVQIGIDIYYGSYEGELENGVPNGTGQFKGETLVGEGILYEGEWSEGKFSGKGVLEYEDGTQLKGSFEDNLCTGIIKVIESTGEYKTVQYYKGIPSGFIESYDVDGNWLAQDYYYRNVLLSELVADATKVKYKTLFKKEKKTQGKTLKIEGIVEIVEDHSTNRYLKIKDYDNNIYICKYKNTYFDTEAQALIPEFEKGDKITLYGYFTNIDLNEMKSDIEGYGYSYPQIEGVYAIKTGEKDIIRNKLKFSYDLICENAYYYYRKDKKWSGEITNVIYSENNIIVELDVGDNKKFMVNSKKYSWKEMPVVGEKIKFLGYVCGYYKKQQGDETYKVYPFLQVKKIYKNKT